MKIRKIYSNIFKYYINSDRVYSNCPTYWTIKLRIKEIFLKKHLIMIKYGC